MASTMKSFGAACGLGLWLSGALAPLAFAQQPPAAAAAPAAPPPILEAEVSDIATLPPATPRRFFVSGRNGGVTIVNGDTAKIEGTVNAAGAAGFAAAPDNSAFYISETIWSRQNRGKRQDLVSIYDGTTLKLVQEIDLPGRLIASGRTPFFSLSANGQRGFVFNLEPAPSVIAVDLVKRKVLSTIETPGCGMIYPFRDEGFASLCADGSLASVAVDAKGKPVITHAPVFFDVEKDPVFEESLVDRQTGKALFITYSGMVYPAELGATSTVGAGWSLQVAAGLAAATSDPQHKTWRPGGRRPFALHRTSNRLFVLMHEGKPWSQKQAGREVWVIDTVEKSLIRRFPVPTAGYTVSVSQDAEPLLYVVSEDGDLWVMDPVTGKLIRNLDSVGRPSLVAVVGF